jgi:hypothetical protein
MVEQTGPKRIPIEHLAWELHTSQGQVKQQALEFFQATSSADFLEFLNGADVWPIGGGGAAEGVVGGIAQDYLPTMKKSAEPYFYDWQAPLASVLYWHGLHVGVEHKILWSAGGPTVDWNATSAGPSGELQVTITSGSSTLSENRSLMVLTDGWFFLTLNANVYVSPVRSVPPPVFQPGLLMGKVLVPFTSERLSGTGVDKVPNDAAKALPELWGDAHAASLRLFFEDGAVRAYSFLPQDDQFVCDGPNCGVITNTDDALRARTTVVNEVFAAAGVEVSPVVASDAVSAWHAVVLKAAAESESSGSPRPVLASHAQMALGIDGRSAKLLVNGARERGLLELPRDTQNRFDDPLGGKSSQDLPFPVEGFGRLCEDCINAIGK